MNFKYLIFLCLMFIVSMGAVSAADDVNSTFNANIDVNDVPVDSVIIDNPIYTNNAKEYTITNDNYGNYFDNETGDALEEAPFNNGDILKIEAIKLKGKGSLTVTGNLGDVMKESSRISYSVVKVLIDNKVLKIDEKIIPKSVKEEEENEKLDCSEIYKR